MKDVAQLKLKELEAMEDKISIMELASREERIMREDKEIDNLPNRKAKRAYQARQKKRK